MKMKKSLRIVALVVLCALTATTASAQLRFGVRAGVNINKLSFNQDAINDVVDSENRTGFTGGITADFGLPLTGLMIDGSLLYTHRNDKLTVSGTDKQTTTLKRDYLDIPINLKYRIDMLGVVKPYLFTGPDFAIMLSDGDDNIADSKTYVSWNMGAGVELLNHLLISASYNIGLSNSIKDALNLGGNNGTVNGKDRTWMVTAAYMF